MKKKVWLITGAGRGMGANIARAALAAGHAVVATGRNSDAVSQALGQSSDLLTVALDVTSRSDPNAAMRAAAERFGRIDVLVNNAASFYAGYFEELTPEQFERQLSVSLIGPMNVTRAVLPVMRKQRAGHIISISSSAGVPPLLHDENRRDMGQGDRSWYSAWPASTLIARDTWHESWSRRESGSCAESKSAVKRFRSSSKTARPTCAIR